ncbi:methyltransferase domain-containing protein [Gemmatimonas sp.]|uniref:class I SAM-dependent methyltransferase n=1 Tax=Gemmatimonas sp. TaxID=1962908 RepID=UPI0035660B9E
MSEPALQGSDERSATDQSRDGEHYYKHDCGLPYERNEHWSRFFGAVADAIVRELRPRTVLDVGCAMGFLVEELRIRGVEAWGVDVSEYAIDHVHPSVAEFCAVSSAANEVLPDRFPTSFDLVTCVEVLEHLGDEDVLRALINLTKHADRLLFSSSPEDHTEATHLNVKPPDEWSARLAALGMWRNLDLDASFLTPWAAVYDRHEPVPPELVAAYERTYVLQGREIRALRAEALRRHSDDVRSSLAHDPALADVPITDLEQQLESTRERLLEAELATLASRDHSIGAEATAGQLRTTANRLETELLQAHLETEQRDSRIGDLLEQIEGMQVVVDHRDALLDSETWKVGAALLSPLRLLRWGRSGKPPS